MSCFIALIFRPENNINCSTRLITNDDLNAFVSLN